MNQTTGGLRKRRPQPAALDYVTRMDDQDQMFSDEPLQRSLLRNIAHTLLVLDLITLRTLKDLGRESDLLEYQPLIDKDPITAKLAEQALTSYPEDPLHTSTFRRELETLSRDELTQRIIEPKKGDFHAKAMLLLKNSTEDASEDERADCMTEWILFLDTDLEADFDNSLPLGVPYYAPTLLLVIRKSQTLHKAFVEVVDKKYLDEKARSSFQERLKKLDIYFEDACRIMVIPYQPLAYLGRDHSRSNPKLESKAHNDTSNSTTPTSNSRQHRTPFVFVFLVPTVCLLSCIPATLAWTNTDTRKGTTADANFCQLLSSALIQMLGIVTSVWPAVTNLQQNHVARIITWGMAVTGAILTVVALPFYLVIPVRWSALLQFSGSILQALLQLQLVLGIYNYKEHHS